MQMCLLIWHKIDSKLEESVTLPKIYNVNRLAVWSSASHSLLNTASIKVLYAIHHNRCVPHSVNLCTIVLLNLARKNMLRYKESSGSMMILHTLAK